MGARLFPLIVLFYFIFPIPLLATTIDIPAQFARIQDGIDAAADGDTVLIAPGRYYEHDIDYGGKAIIVMSHAPGVSDTVDATVVDGGSMGSVFMFHSRENPSSVLAGLTITHGRSKYGGGIYCRNSSPDIRDNVITGNTAAEDAPTPEGEQTPDREESAGVAAPYDGAAGGGIFCEKSSPSIAHNQVVNNSAGFGGGVYCRHSSPLISNNLVSSNFATGKGGGIRCEDDSSPTIRNNDIRENEAVLAAGGMLIRLASSPTVSNNVIEGNISGAAGGGIKCMNEGSSPIISNNLIMRNSAIEGGGFCCGGNSTPTITNSVFFENTAYQGEEIFVSSRHDMPTTLVINYSDIHGGLDEVYVMEGSAIDWGNGMIDADPAVISRRGFDGLLSLNSPCIDAGDPDVEDGIDWPEWYGDQFRSDMGAYGGPSDAGWLLQ